MGVASVLAVGVGAGLDGLVGELPTRVHPVALFGRLAGQFDREWSVPRPVGVVVAAGLPVLAGGVAWLLVALAGRLDPLASGLAAGLVLFATTSLRLLVGTADEVVAASATEIEAARERVPGLVGRDPESLSAGQLRSAAVESAAENLADGLVAPLTAFALGSLVSLPLAAAAAAWVKGVNTLDSMLGYRSKPVGWASARLDDLVMALPARLSAVAIAVAALDPGALWRARRWAGLPPSPNSGRPMATLAAALDVRLVKPDVYDLNPEAALPTVEAGHRAVGIVTGAGAISWIASGVIAWW